MGKPPKVTVQHGQRTTPGSREELTIAEIGKPQHLYPATEVRIYEELYPGAAELILKEALESSKHEREEETKDNATQRSLSWAGLGVGAVIMLCVIASATLVSIYSGQPWPVPVSMVGLGISAILGPIIRNNRKR